MDYKILVSVQDIFKCAFMDYFMKAVSFLSNAGWLWLCTSAGLLLSEKYRRYGYIMGLSLIICFLVGNLSLKPLFARPRPYEVYPFDLIINKLYDFSFPSGHTYSAFCAAGTLFHFNKKIGAAAFVLAFLIAFSRIYLFVHYPSDVLAGIILGLLTALASITIIEKIFKNTLTN